ncbi:hypothetical protein B7463_g3585, partial [Scytalidium lignicola]
MNILKLITIRDDTYNGHATTRWFNPDIAPLPPSRRTWTALNYLSFWGVAIITLGMYGSYLGILIRIILAVVAYAIQAWLGGLCVVCILSSWSYSFFTMVNTLPESAHMVTRDFVGFVIFHVISVPFMFIRPENARNPVAVANAITFLVMMALCIWATSRGGVGPLIHKGGGYTMMSRSWAWLYGISSSVGGVISGVLNQSDFTRFAHKQGVQVVGNIFSLLVLGTIIPIFSILTASATVNIYGGDPYWNPLTIVMQWMTDNYTPGSRAAAFFCSLGLLISQLAENIYGNAYSGGIDLSGLFPKYINIRRGCFLCALLSWAVQPWLVFNSASVFVATMSAFTVFLVPLVGIMLTDYFIIRKQRIELSQLYTSDPDGAYWFHYGFNWRAILVWIVCFAPGIPGMINSINPTIQVGSGMTNYFRGNYIYSFIGSVLFYTILMKAFPPKRIGVQDDYDVYGTYTEYVAEVKGMVPFKAPVIDGQETPIEGEELSAYKVRNPRYVRHEHDLISPGPTSSYVL